jgi:hypothetical protein
MEKNDDKVLAWVFIIIIAVMLILLLGFLAACGLLEELALISATSIYIPPYL